MSESKNFDLEEQLLNYGARIISQAMGPDYADRHIANQLLRSGTAPREPALAATDRSVPTRHEQP